MSTETTTKSMSVNVRVSGALRQFVERTTTSGDYENVSEYVRDLIRKDKAQTEEAAFLRVKTELQSAFSVPEGEVSEVSVTDIKKLAKATRS